MEGLTKFNNNLICLVQQAVKITMGMLYYFGLAFIYRIN